MSQKLGLSEDGFARIAEAAERQRKREAATAAALEPSTRHYASIEEVQQDFYKKDGKIMDRQAHRVWELKAQPGGGFDLIRAQDESLEPPEPEGLGEAPEGLGLSAKLVKAASRGARYHAQMAPTFPPAEEPTVEAQAPAEMPPAAPPVGAMPAPTAQAPAEMPVQSPGMPAPTAQLQDVVETPEDQRLAGLARGSRVVVRIGRRDIMKGKVLARTATHFDILLDNSATTRVLHRDVAPDAPTRAPARSALDKKAVDSKAKDYWEAYYKEYGSQLVKSDLPRAVTDRAEPATPKSKQKTPTKSAAKAVVGDVVDIGNIWMASKTLRSGVVRVIRAGVDKVAVVDPFGGKMVVPRKAVVAVRDAADFVAARRGGVRLNRARILQAASAALTWDQVYARYPKAVDQIREVRRWVAAGIRIALAKGAVPVRSQAAVFGRQAARADWNPKLRKQALDELGKSYYQAYWGDYGTDLVKEVRRRIKADILDRQLGRQAAPSRPQPPQRAASASPPPQRTAKPSLRQTLANALAAHVAGMMKRAGAQGSYTVDPATIEVTSSTTERNRRLIAGRFVGKFVGPDRQAVARKPFEMVVEDGKVKAIKIPA